MNYLLTTLIPTMSQTLLVLGMTKLNKMGPALKELSLRKIQITMITTGVKATTKTATAFSGYSQQCQGMLLGWTMLDLCVIIRVSGWIWEKDRYLKCNNRYKSSFTREHDAEMILERGGAIQVNGWKEGKERVSAGDAWGSNTKRERGFGPLRTQIETNWQEMRVYRQVGYEFQRVVRQPPALLRLLCLMECSQESREMFLKRE